MDASLGDGDPTLLHHFVDGRAVHVRHLVKLIDANHASVSQDHGPRFQTAFPWGGGKVKTHATVWVVGGSERFQSPSQALLTVAQEIQ